MSDKAVVDGDLRDFVRFMCHLDDVPNFLALFNPCTLLYSSLHKEVMSMVVA
jgi:hypothetical protein